MVIPQICKCVVFGILPSTRREFGITGIEMMSSGLPLVTSNVHEIKDYMMDRETGYICNPMCNPFDVHAVAVGLEKLCDAQTRMSLKLKCIESEKRFNTAITIQ